MRFTSGFFYFIVSAALLGCARPSEDVGLTRKPYLQCAISDSTTVLWRTNKGNTCKVAYRPRGYEEWFFTNGQTRETNTLQVENEVVLKGLQPATVYEYRIFTDDTHLLSEKDLHFKSPISDQDSIFSFFAVGDVGEPIAEGGTPDQLAKALAGAVDSLDFGLLLGDIIYPEGQSAVYDENLFDHFGEVFPYVPVFTILGNHDWYEPENNYLLEWKLPGNEHYYSFDYGKVHFAALDTKMGDFYEYETQVKWLEEDLAGALGRYDWLIVYLHHNGRSCTYKQDYERVVALYPVFDRYGVDLVLNGHAHTYERLNPMNGQGEPIPEYLGNTDAYADPQGFISITAGSGGKLRGVGSDPKPYTPDPENCRYPNLTAKAAHLWAYLQLSVNGKTLYGKALSTEDLNVVDEFVVTKM